MASENPILNNPYDAPKLHYATDADGDLNYNDIRNIKNQLAEKISSI